METCSNFLFSGGDDCVVRIWNIHNWNCIQMLRAHRVRATHVIQALIIRVCSQDEVWALKVLEDQTLITGSLDGTIRVWKCRQESASVQLLIPLNPMDDSSLEISGTDAPSSDSSSPVRPSTISGFKR